MTTFLVLTSLVCAQVIEYPRPEEQPKFLMSSRTAGGAVTFASLMGQLASLSDANTVLVAVFNGCTGDHLTCLPAARAFTISHTKKQKCSATMIAAILIAEISTDCCVVNPIFVAIR